MKNNFLILAGLAGLVIYFLFRDKGQAKQPGAPGGTGGRQVTRNTGTMDRAPSIAINTSAPSLSLPTGNSWVQLAAAGIGQLKPIFSGLGDLLTRSEAIKPVSDAPTLDEKMRNTGDSPYWEGLEDKYGRTFSTTANAAGEDYFEANSNLEAAGMAPMSEAESWYWQNI